jgi:hypothetical protein
MSLQAKLLTTSYSCLQSLNPQSKLFLYFSTGSEISLEKANAAAFALQLCTRRFSKFVVRVGCKLKQYMKIYANLLQWK